MSKAKRLQEKLQEEELHSNETLNVPKKTTKEVRIMVKPEYYQQVINYLHNSIPKNNTVTEVVNLINSLSQTSVQGEVTFNGN